MTNLDKIIKTYLRHVSKDILNQVKHKERKVYRQP